MDLIAPQNLWTEKARRKVPPRREVEVETSLHRLHKSSNSPQELSALAEGKAGWGAADGVG